ncbi:YczE/YyaS/YitT family protein [Actinotignum sp. GS-2025a]|uniref:YczE/YyaS/YitT family protein n=1 Tax=Actinotignum sp. GS-2025a TaxID=3427274 RepID=UPI003F4509FD
MSRARAPWWLWVIRYLVLALGLFIMGFGIQLAIASDLGTSPISSLPYVVSRMTPISVGTLTGCMHVVFIVIQLALLRREFPPLEFLQLPMALLMATGIDAAGAILGPITYSSYTQQWLLCLGGVAVLAVGICVEVSSGAVVNAGEGVVIAIYRKTVRRFGVHRWTNFGAIKVYNDAALVALATALSFAVLGELVGVREGTLAAAVLTGPAIRLVTPWLGVPLRRLLRLA